MDRQSDDRGGPAGADLIIETHGLGKLYGSVRGIEDLDLEVRRGEVFGLLGPNGAGKTTTIRLLLGLLRPSAGVARVLGSMPFGGDVRARAELGYLPATVTLWPECRGLELLEFFGRFRPTSPPTLRDDMCRRLGLHQHDLGRKVGAYSTGMRQKLLLILAMQHDPELLILDEPTSGLDPLVREALFEIFEELHRRGRTLLVSSHNLAEVERLCDRVGIVREGRLVALEEVAELKRRLPRRISIAFAAPPPDELFQTPGLERLDHDAGRLELRFTGEITVLLNNLAGCKIADLIIRPPSFDEVFLEIYRSDEGLRKNK